MNNLQILELAAKYSRKDQANMNLCINHLYILKGWGTEEVLAKFIEFCLEGAKEFKANPGKFNNHSGYTQTHSGDAAEIAVFVDYAIGHVIRDLQSKQAA